ncbi:MAG TPA: cysteine--tRNA ligase [Dehalococcoidia bacterium]|nr:cysteine--tRNA ligase [Dehalococcoidia bacterium]
MRLHNTLTGRVEEFTPIDNKVKMYVCGITPYSESHLGHAMFSVVFDTLRRYLEFRGCEVRHVQNYTDIDDKLIARAEREGVPMADVAARYIREFEQDMRTLNVLPAHVYPRATEEVPAIIEMIEGLIEKGYAYAGPARGVEEASDVYFRVEKKEDYGKLAKRSLDSMLMGARIEPLEGKENPMDFTLWKAAKPGEPAWESPWGPGRPGWHIECSAMSLRHLGPQIDIHGGGLDLVFPHHENEIAQTEAYTGLVPFSRFWMHNGFLQLGDEKMSKSLGNLINMHEAIERYGPDGVRIFILGSGYRSPLTYSEEAMSAGKTAAERLRNAAAGGEGGSGDPVDGTPFRERFIAAMEDDMNTSQALSVLFELARELNRERDAGRNVANAIATLRELAGVLGLRLEAVTQDAIAAAPFIDLLIELRKELRDAKQYALADRIRNGLGDLGIVLEDSAGGTTWKPKD